MKAAGAVEEISAALALFWDQFTQAFIFGSYARAEQTARSDIDLMLIGDISLASLTLALRRVEEIVGMEVNVTVYSVTEFGERGRGDNHFIRTVLNDKKIFLKGNEDELAILAGKRETAAAYGE